MFSKKLFDEERVRIVDRGEEGGLYTRGHALITIQSSLTVLLGLPLTPLTPLPPQGPQIITSPEAPKPATHNLRLHPKNHLAIESFHASPENR